VFTCIAAAPCPGAFIIKKCIYGLRTEELNGTSTVSINIAETYQHQ